MDDRRRRLLPALVSLFLAYLPGSATATPIVDAPGAGEGLKLVSEVGFENGSHLELTRIKGRDYAFVNTWDPQSEAASLLVFDVTEPERTRKVAELACGGFQGSIQVSHDRRTLLVGLDGPAAPMACAPSGDMGFMTIDITDPTKPRPVGWASLPNGSHSLAAHPKKPFVYNAEGFPDTAGDMQVWSIKDPAKPKLVNTLDTGLHSPHDISFSRDGDMAASANVVNFHVLDTTDPADPKILATSQCPGCLHTHEARFTPDGKRLVVNDEYPLAPACPSGALYFYDLSETGEPVLSGGYVAGDIVANGNAELAGLGLCTPHVFDISDDGKRLAASWHHAGIKHLDITSSAGYAVGKQTLSASAPKELGWYASEGGDAFTVKLHRGPYLYVVDARLGLQIFRPSS